MKWMVVVEFSLAMKITKQLRYQCVKEREDHHGIVARVAWKYQLNTMYYYIRNDDSSNFVHIHDDIINKKVLVHVYNYFIIGLLIIPVPYLNQMSSSKDNDGVSKSQGKVGL